ncbi:LysR family transcriptional regulator [Aurantimonas sp. VKM B-3413]|uniref:LysR family transcriptional regulator n=1 Tax=Aurantimonas sp. VKM B-3413 TaxID=2779401 RepID=UPI001E575E3F|nr:LysR family transcriptional regulator [Aurantimonas sp. VKM B-3413]MCB8840029.1 LysR family transcriptional regulator [Aurantimonas sp. VKM B-3413]
MDRMLLPHLPILLAVARKSGFAAAAAELGMSPSAVSHAVRAVEDRLGEPLFARTTRSVSLTQAGESFLAAVGPALDDIAKASEGITARGGEITGLLRLTVPQFVLDMGLTPILVHLSKLHPHLTVELHAEDALVDIVETRFDAGIRLGETIQQDMVALRLTPSFRSALVASKQYLEANGTPQSLEDLAGHNCIGFRSSSSGGVYDWPLNDCGQIRTFKTTGTALVSDAGHARDLAIAGLGIAYMFEPLVRAHLLDGRLEQILPHSSTDLDGLFLYYPRRASLAPKLRAFVDVAKKFSGSWDTSIPNLSQSSQSL